MTPPRDVVAVLGNLARDCVDGGSPRPGGCPVFAALTFRLLGREGRIVARCADVDRPLFDELLTVPGVPVTMVPGTQTSGFDHVYDGDERQTTVTAVGDTWNPDVADLLDERVAWVHVAPLLRSDAPAGTLAALAADDRIVSLDGQGLVRAPRPGPLTEDADFDPRLPDHIAVLKLSEHEAAVVAGGAFDVRAARRLGVREIVVTLGARGADVWVDTTPTHVPARPVTGVETTGAGDAFMVAYAAARVDGAGPVEAARAGSELVHRLLIERKRGA